MFSPAENNPLPPNVYAGMEWMIDARECDAKVLMDLSEIVALCWRVTADLGLKVLGHPLAHTFPSPGGVTAMFMLSESHLACHTYPEHRLATFNLYCCADRPTWPWEEELSRRLAARSVVIRSIQRGLLTSADPIVPASSGGLP